MSSGCSCDDVSSQQSPPEIQAPLSRSRFLQPELFRASLYNGRPALTDLQFRQSQTRRLDTWQSQNAVSCRSLARSLASWSRRIDELTRRLRITVLRAAAPSRAAAAVLRAGWLRRQGDVGGKAPASPSDRPTARAGTAAPARPPALLATRRAGASRSTRGVVLKKKWGGRLKQDLDKDFQTI